MHVQCSIDPVWIITAYDRLLGRTNGNMNRRVALLGLFVFLVLAGWPGMSFGESSIRIVDNGKPLASIVISKVSSEQVHSAASLLQDYVKKASKATLPIREASDIRSGENKQVLIWVGPSN